MTDTTQYRELLTAEYERIVRELQSIATHNPETDDWIALPPSDEQPDADDNTDADIVEDWNERRAVLAALESEYQDIKRSLKKIEDGTFGICEISGEPIEGDRLAAHPTARTCTKHMDEETSLPRT